MQFPPICVYNNIDNDIQRIDYDKIMKVLVNDIKKYKWIFGIIVKYGFSNQQLIDCVRSRNLAIELKIMFNRTYNKINDNNNYFLVNETLHDVRLNNEILYCVEKLKENFQTNITGQVNFEFYCYTLGKMIKIMNFSSVYNRQRLFSEIDYIYITEDRQETPGMIRNNTNSKTIYIAISNTCDVIAFKHYITKQNNNSVHGLVYYYCDVENDAINNFLKCITNNKINYNNKYLVGFSINKNTNGKTLYGNQLLQFNLENLMQHLKILFENSDKYYKDILLRHKTGNKTYYINGRKAIHYVPVYTNIVSMEKFKERVLSNNNDIIIAALNYILDRGNMLRLFGKLTVNNYKLKQVQKELQAVQLQHPPATIR